MKGNKKNKKQNKKNVKIVTQTVIKSNGRPRKTRGTKTRKMSKTKGMGKLEVSDCAAKYACAVGDPWSEAALGACVPRLSRPSRKARGYIYNEGTIPTTGPAVLMIMPCVVSDKPCMVVSDGTAAFTGAPIRIGGVTPTAGITSIMCSNLPYVGQDLYDADNYENKIQGRIVPCGVRITYDSEAINEGGHTIAYVHPDHQNLNGTIIGGIFDVNRQPYRMNRSLEYVLSAISDEECDYPQGPWYNVEAGTNARGRLSWYPFSQGLAFSVDDQSTGGSPFQLLVYGKAETRFTIEYVIHVEYIGQTVANTTKTEDDLKGLSIVREIAATATSKRVDPKSGAWTQVFKEAVRDATHLVNDVIDLRMALKGIGI